MILSEVTVQQRARCVQVPVDFDNENQNARCDTRLLLDCGYSLLPLQAHDQIDQLSRIAHEHHSPDLNVIELRAHRPHHASAQASNRQVASIWK